MYQSVLARQDGDERTEVHLARDAAFIDAAHFHFRGDQLDATLRDAVSLRLRADVPVAGYLSGGLDSSIICRLARDEAPELTTFSVTFEDPRLDERLHQERVAKLLGTRHVSEHITTRMIGDAFPEVVRHVETPLIRTAPAPLYLLARLTRSHGTKVVLTGEGADEFFLGYDLYKETAVRQFCLRQPESKWRPRLFDRLYPYLTDGRSGGEFWRRYFLDAGPVTDPFFSHLPRITLTAFVRDFYSADVRAALAGYDARAELLSGLPAGFADWSPMKRANQLEVTTLLGGYLLSSQGDRVAMAHGVEGRYPFLDPRMVALATRLPARSKLRTLREKDILRRWAGRILPQEVRNRPKQPYRAPIREAFGGGDGRVAGDIEHGELLLEHRDRTHPPLETHYRSPYARWEGTTIPFTASAAGIAPGSRIRSREGWETLMRTSAVPPSRVRVTTSTGVTMEETREIVIAEDAAAALETLGGTAGLGDYKARLQALCGRLKQLVAAPMPERIVNVLEVIEIQITDSERTSTAQAMSEFPTDRGSSR